MRLSTLVSTEVSRRFSPDHAEAAREVLESTPLPFLDERTRETERQRVQLAAIKYAAGDLDKLRQATELARIDWRDLLMATGLGGENWRVVLERDGFPVPPASVRMVIERVTPILNVSNLQETFDWFEKLGWTKAWDWGDPPDFGGVCCGKFEIYLCLNGQGGRGKGPSPMTFGRDGDEGGDKGVWMMIAVEDVDSLYRHCLAEGLDVTWPPTDMPWGMREMHVRHPDGHVLRIGRGLEETKE